MIGLSIISGLVCYVLFAWFITKLILKKTERLLYKRLAIAFFILLPTWDVIIGFPLYWYLCKFHSGMEIYKTVDDVQGFYVGEKYLQPIMPEKGYKYIDYKLTGTDQYYCNTWLNNNTHKDCYLPTNKTGRKYKEIYNAGRCIVIDSISFADVSRYEVRYGYKTTDDNQQLIQLVKVNVVQIVVVLDQKNKNILSRLIKYRWNQGWIVSNFLAISGSSWKSCYFKKDSSNSLIEKTLKQ